jgi:hypothetical protein
LVIGITKRPVWLGQVKVRSRAKFTKAGADIRRCPWSGVKGFVLTLLLSVTARSSAACLLVNPRLIPFSPAAVYAAQILVITGIIAFPRKISAENREKIKQSGIIEMGRSWNH